MSDPLIVTLQLDPESQERFDALRREHFPAERNHLRAHVTLFHALPGAEIQSVRTALAEAAQRIPFEISVARVRFLGAGVAYDLASPELARLRSEIARAQEPWLTRQDSQPFRPHVTVQNKVSPELARELHARLEAAFTPHVVQARGLELWHYVGGPWRHETSFPFDSPAD